MPKQAPLGRLLGYVKFRKELLEGEIWEWTCYAGTTIQETHETHPGIRDACAQSIDDHLAMLRAHDRRPLREFPVAGCARRLAGRAHPGGAPGRIHHGQGAPGRGRPRIDSIDHLYRYIELLFADQANANAEGAPMHRVVNREQWIAERRQLLQEEKEFTRRRDALAEKRRALPWVKVDKRYEFDSPQGRVTLADLFRGRSQLFVQHVMQGPDQPLQCVGCALGIDHLEEPAAASREPRRLLRGHCARDAAGARQRCATRMGWRIPFYSSFGSDFNYDYGVSFKPEDMAAGRAFYNYGTAIRASKTSRATACSSRTTPATSSTPIRYYARGGEDFLGIYRILEVTPRGPQ